MPEFGSKSRNNLESCHPDIQVLLNEAIKYIDFSVICGYRNKQAQDKAYLEKRSKVEFPNSKHNKVPSIAVDIVPYPDLDWDDTARFYLFIGTIKGIALTLGIKIRLGADWDGDGKVKDQNFHDLPHIELILEGSK